MVNALVDEADEGRGSLRKASDSWQTSVLIRRFPNEETHQCFALELSITNDQ
jgi:hypothetical protein